MKHKLQYNSPVVLTYFFISLAVLIADGLTGGKSTALLFSVYRAPLTDPLFYPRLVGHVLGHAGWSHFINNMLLFLVVGPPMEEKYGSRNLLLSILITAILSGILQCALFPSSALLGASGIVFMLVLMSSLAGMKEGRLPLTLILVAGLYLAQQCYGLIFVRENTAYLMHIAGGVSGTGIGLLLENGGKRR